MGGFVAVVCSYRTHPEGTAVDMANDVASLLNFWSSCASSFRSNANSTVLLSHSSGAHICSLALMRNSHLATKLCGAAFLNGVFDVKTHYEYEKSRGVHEISMLAEACERARDVDFKDVRVTELVPSSLQVRLPPM